MNPKALILTSVALAGVLGLGVWLKLTQPGRLRATALAQAERALADGRPDKALRHLDHFLGTSPDDVPAVELKARILAEAARGADDLREAARWNDLLLRLDPGGPGRQDTRRRLAELYIRFSDALRNSPQAASAPEMVAREVRYQSAESVAREMIRVDPSDGSGHRLLGTALEGRADAVEAAASYEAALRLDPRDAVASERLADLCRVRLKDPARAEAVLDAMLRADPKAVAVRLARARCYDRSGDGSRSAAELAEAVVLAPSDASVRLAAAEAASRSGDLKAARAHLDAIPAEAREGLRARLARGMVDLAERRPDDAIEGWRAGLASTGGSDADMTWWLAFVLLQMDRVAEASPLVAQYARLAGDEASPRAVLLRAMLDEKVGRPLEGIDRLEKVAERADGSLRPLIFQALGRCREAVWDAEGALRDYREAAAADPGNPTPRLAVARLLEPRKPDEAVAYLRRACQAVPADPALHTALAEALLRRQALLPAARRSWAEVDAALTDAARLAPGSAAVAMIQADRRTLAGDDAGATASLEAATRSSPRDPAAWVAYATLLDRRGKPEAALAALEAAATPGAVGDRAAIRIASSRVLAGMGRGRDARARLTRDLGGLAPTDRTAIFEELGRLSAAQGDPDAARAAFREWAALVPDGLQPRMALLDLALASDDDAQVHAAVASLREVAGSQGVTGRIARVIEIIREVGKDNKDVKARASDPAVAEAQQLIEEVRRLTPENVSVALFHGKLLEELGQVDGAVAEYRRAWDRGLDDALPRLVALLARNRRIDDLAALGRDHQADARVARLLTQAARELGDSRSAEALLAAAGIAEARAVRARALAAEGKVPEAEALLRAGAEAADGAEGPWLDLLRFQAGHGRDQAAAETVATIKARVKTPRPEVLEALCLSIIGDRAGAARAMAAALKARPDDPDILIAAAGVAQSAGRPDQAAAYLLRARELDPKRDGLARAAAVAMATAAHDLDAWKAAWDALGPEAADPDSRLARAFVLTRCPDPTRRREAVPLLEALLADLNVDHPAARQARGYLVPLLLADGQVDRAARVTAPAVARSRSVLPSDLALHAEVLLRKRDFASARPLLDRWHEAAPDDAGEAAMRARLIREEGPPASVAQALERAYLDRGDTPSARAMGVEAFNILFDMGDPAASIAARVADRLAKASPALSWAAARVAAREGRRNDAFRLARAAIASGGPTEARQAARAAMDVATAPTADDSIREAASAILAAAARRAPGVADIPSMWGILRHIQGRYDDEASLYRAALDIQPDHAIARNNLAWVLAEDQDHPAEGLALIDALIRDAGPDADRLGTRGVARMRLGRHAEALTDLEEAARLQQMALNHYYLALAYHKAGREADARRALADARKGGLDPNSLDTPRRAECRALLASSGAR